MSWPDMMPVSRCTPAQVQGLLQDTLSVGLLRPPVHGDGLVSRSSARTRSSCCCPLATPWHHSWT